MSATERTFSSSAGAANYPLPNDDREHARLDLQHSFIKQAQGGEVQATNWAALYIAPPSPNVLRNADYAPKPVVLIHV